MISLENITSASKTTTLRRRRINPKRSKRDKNNNLGPVCYKCHRTVRTEYYRGRYKRIRGAKPIPSSRKTTRKIGKHTFIIIPSDPLGILTPPLWINSRGRIITQWRCRHCNVWTLIHDDDNEKLNMRQKCGNSLVSVPLEVLLQHDQACKTETYKGRASRAKRRTTRVRESQRIPLDSSQIACSRIEPFGLVQIYNPPMT